MDQVLIEFRIDLEPGTYHYKGVKNLIFDMLKLMEFIINIKVINVKGRRVLCF